MTRRLRVKLTLSMMLGASLKMDLCSCESKRLGVFLCLRLNSDLSVGLILRLSLSLIVVLPL